MGLYTGEQKGYAGVARKTASEAVLRGVLLTVSDAARPFRAADPGVRPIQLR